MNTKSNILNIKVEPLLENDIIKKNIDKITYENIVKPQIIYHFLINVLEKFHNSIMTDIQFINYVKQYLDSNKIIYNNDTINKTCIKFIERNFHDGIININDLKRSYQSNILQGKYNISELSDINYLINLYTDKISNTSIIRYNYIEYYYKIIIYNNIKNIIWISIYLSLNIFVFIYKFYKTKNSDNGIIFGTGLAVSKGMAHVCLLNSFLVLLPVLTSISRFLRKFDILIYIIPFNNNIIFHKITGWNIFISGLIHTIFHLITYINKIIPMDKEIWEDTMSYKNGFLSSGRDFNNFIISVPIFSGIILLLLFIISIPFTFKYFKNKNINLFLYSHYLLFPVYFIFIIIHGYKGYFESPSSWKWVVFPCIIYIIEKLYKYFQKINVSGFNLIDYELNNNFIMLKISKDKYFNNYNPSMYIFLNIPEISKIEWHPFTIISHPESNYIKLYIENVGNWTNSLYESLLNHNQCITTYIDGPINSPV